MLFDMNQFTNASRIEDRAYCVARLQERFPQPTADSSKRSEPTFPSAAFCLTPCGVVLVLVP